MEATLNQNGVLTLFFKGELNSTNADAVEKEVKGLIASHPGFSSIVLDFAELTYISSAGLRIVFGLKKEYGDVSIVETSLAVYDVLSMTGFDSIMKVSKALTKIDVTGAEIVGDGFFSTVYRLNKDTIVKVFNRVSDPDQIQRELKLAKQAFILGIPTAISFDIVKVGEKLGVRFEMLDCISLKKAFEQYPERYEELIDSYAKLLKTINTTDCMDESLPKTNEQWLGKLEAIAPRLDKADYEKAKKLLQGIPDSMNFVHGDCHFKNIMMQGNDLLLIDMDTLSRGDAIFELAAIRAPYLAFEEIDPGNTVAFFGFQPDVLKKLYDDTIKTYLGEDDPSNEDKITVVCYVHMAWWHSVNKPDRTDLFDRCKQRLHAALAKVDDLRLGGAR